jgi:hypothetical protein
MKTFIKYSICYFLLFFSILYFSSINEGMEVLGLSENEKCISKTFEYFFFWVIPFWWFYLLLASIIAGIITTLIARQIRRLQKPR